MSKVRLPARYYLWRCRPLFAYSLIVLVGAVGFYQSERADRQSLEDRCATRNAVRTVYSDIEALATDLVNSSDLDAASRQERLVRIRAFKETRIAELPPIEGCEEVDAP